MSLINEMLKNLEAQPRTPVSPEGVLIGMQSSLTAKIQKSRILDYAVRLAGFVLLVLFSILVRNIYMHHRHVLEHDVKNTQTQSVTNQKNLGLTPDMHASATMLTGIALQMQNNLTNLRFLLNQNTLYRVSSDVEKHELTIVLEHTQLLAALPKINYVGSGVEHIQAYIDEYSNLKLVLKLSNNTEIKRLELSQDGKAPELELDLLYQSDANSAEAVLQKSNTIPVTIKNPVMESMAEQRYQRALVLSAAGSSLEAVQLLKTLLTDAPHHQLARKLLASLLWQQGNKVEAKKVIDIGLNLDPNNIDLIELKARALVDEDKIATAIALLEKSAPSLAENPEYHAFIAALYQRTGQSTLAANLYKQLLINQPGNPKLWLGLGVALEASGSHSQALEAYANADNVGNLNPELKAYVETQLHNA